MIGKRINQEWLENTVQYLFPNTSINIEPTLLNENWKREDILVNSRKETQIKNPKTGQYLELDVVVPQHNICFEFQVFNTD